MEKGGGGGVEVLPIKLLILMLHNGSLTGKQLKFYSVINFKILYVFFPVSAVFLLVGFHQQESLLLVPQLETALCDLHL